MTLNEFKNIGCNVNELTIRKYVPANEKIEGIKTVLEKLYKENTDIFKVRETVKEKIACEMTAIILYSNLEISDVSDYDFLKENGIFDVIVGSVGSDYREYNLYFSMIAKDSFEPLNQISTILNKTNEVLNGLTPEIVQELLSYLGKM